MSNSVCYVGDFYHFQAFGVFNKDKKHQSTNIYSFDDYCNNQILDEICVQHILMQYFY